MRRTGFALVTCVCLVCLFGCDQGGSQPAANGPQADQMLGCVAVIDLDEVAKRLGEMDDIREALDAQGSELNEQLSSLQTSAREAYEGKVEELGEAPEEDPDKQAEIDQELQVVRRNINVRLDQARKQAQNIMTTKQQRLVSRFREEVKPVARRVAAARGLTVVVPKSDNLSFVFVPEVDITEEVIEEMTGGTAPKE